MKPLVVGSRQQREKLGLKQHDLAHALQVSPQAVSKWERGENAPDIALLIPLAKLLGISTDSLLGYNEGEADVFEATVCRKRGWCSVTAAILAMTCSAC